MHTIRFPFKSTSAFLFSTLTGYEPLSLPLNKNWLFSKLNTSIVAIVRSSVSTSVARGKRWILLCLCRKIRNRIGLASRVSPDICLWKIIIRGKKKIFMYNSRKDNIKARGAKRRKLARACVRFRIENIVKRPTPNNII